MWDLLIQNGTVVNPEGQMKADIALQGEKVVAVGKLQNMQARQIIDAQGKWVLPGMIDSHAHIQTGVGSEDQAILIIRALLRLPAEERPLLWTLLF